MRLFKFAIIIFLATYLFLILYYYFSQKKFIFFPSKTYLPPPAHLNIEEVNIATIDGEQLHGWWLANNKADKTALFFHGNAGNITDRTFRMEIFKTLNLSALMIDYRGYGRSSGLIKKEQDLYNDAMAAWRFLVEDKQAAPNSIIIWGRSLGGGVACDLAQKLSSSKTAPDKGLAAVVSESTFPSLSEIAPKQFRFMSINTILKFDFDNGEKIKDIKAPILIVHSQDDEIAAFEQREKLFKAALEPKQFLKLKGGHNSDIAESHQVYIQGVKDFLQKH